MSHGTASTPLTVVVRPSRARLRFAASALAALLLTAPACSRDKPKPDDETAKSEPTPVPSGLVFNDFLPPSGKAEGLGVRDAGGEGLAAIGAGSDTDEAGEAPADGVKVTEAGAEPRAKRKYTFVPNRVDKRTLTLTQSATQVVDGQSTGAGEGVTFQLLLDLSVKQVTPTGATVEAKVTKVELEGAPKEAAPMLAAMSGLTGTFDVTSRGEVGEVSFVATQQMRNQLAETVVQGMSQAVQLLYAPLPEAAIGVGAQWELGEAAADAAEHGVKRFTLKEVKGEAAVIDADVEIKLPRRGAQGPGGVPMFLEVEGKGSYTYQVRFDRASTRVEGALSLQENIELVDPRGGGKQSVVRVQNVKHLVDSPK